MSTSWLMTHPSDDLHPLRGWERNLAGFLERDELPNEFSRYFILPCHQTRETLMRLSPSYSYIVKQIDDAVAYCKSCEARLPEGDAAGESYLHAIESLRSRIASSIKIIEESRKAVTGPDCKTELSAILNQPASDTRNESKALELVAYQDKTVHGTANRSHEVSLDEDASKYKPAAWFNLHHAIPPARLSEAARDKRVRTRKAASGVTTENGKRVLKLYHEDDALKHCQPKHVKGSTLRKSGLSRSL